MIDIDSLYEKKICLYGFGVYGIRAYYLLIKYGIKPFCFADKNEKKHGYAIGGLKCISFDDVLNFNREEVVIIVCNRFPDEILIMFKDARFESVFSLNELRTTLSNYCIGDIEVIDNEEVIELKNAIEQVVLQKNYKPYKGFGEQMLNDIIMLI